MFITRHKIVVCIQIKMKMMDRRLQGVCWELNCKDDYKKAQDCGKYKDRDDYEDDGSRLQRLYWELN